jgi:hypothetical protein
MITLAPIRAHAIATPLPMPEEAPVTKIVLSIKENGFCFISIN